MKYFVTAIAAIIITSLVWVKVIQWLNQQQEVTVSPCSPRSVVSAKNPDARFSHCRDKDWDGSTLLRDRLAESREKWEQYQILYEGDSSRVVPVPNDMTTDDNPPPNDPQSRLDKLKY